MYDSLRRRCRSAPVPILLVFHSSSELFDSRFNTGSSAMARRRIGFLYVPSLLRRVFSYLQTQPVSACIILPAQRTRNLCSYFIPRSGSSPSLSAYTAHDVAQCLPVSYNFEIFEPLYIISLLPVTCVFYISEIMRRANLKPTFKRVAVLQNAHSPRSSWNKNIFYFFNFTLMICVCFRYLHKTSCSNCVQL